MLEKLTRTLENDQNISFDVCYGDYAENTL